jgi:predicted RNA methylase
MRPSLTALVALALMLVSPLRAQERFSFFQASTPENVRRMLTLAQLQDGDVIVDLGSGNGLIAWTAARMNPKLRGRGVDIDPKLVVESNRLAAEEGVADRVRFHHQNAFDADLKDATVITMCSCSGR